MFAASKIYKLKKIAVLARKIAAKRPKKFQIYFLLQFLPMFVWVLFVAITNFFA